METEFPNSTHKDCYFHYTQAVHRTVQKLRLSLLYKNDERMKMFSRYLMATPHSKVSDWLLELCKTQVARKVFQEYPALADLCGFFIQRGFYLIPEMRRCFQRENDCRKTNYCESWHSQWHRKLSRSRLICWATLRLLKKGGSPSQICNFTKRKSSTSPAQKLAYF